MEPTSDRQKRSRIFVVAFIVLVIALSVLATVLIRSGQQDAEFQQELQELREQGR